MLDRIYIEISNICNVQCSFCPVVERDKNIMSIEDFKKILAQAKPKAKEV
jgi:2-iminoacetate synthase ThiH